MFVFKYMFQVCLGRKTPLFMHVVLNHTQMSRSQSKFEDERFTTFLTLQFLVCSFLQWRYWASRCHRTLARSLLQVLIKILCRTVNVCTILLCGCRLTTLTILDHLQRAVALCYMVTVQSAFTHTVGRRPWLLRIQHIMLRPNTLTRF